MPVQNTAVLAFNRGVLSLLGLARVDLNRYRMAAQTMVNWIARVLGSMMLRPGWAYLGTTAGNGQARTISFVFSATDTARIELTQGLMRIWVADALLSRIVVGTAVTNGTFLVNTAGWTNSSEAGAAVTWTSAGVVSFVGTGTNNAILDQQVNVAGIDQGNRHALRIVVLRGPFTFRIGTAQGDDSLVNETTLNAGTHSLAFTPNGAFWIRFAASSQAASQLASCVIEGPGTLTLPVPWQTADIPNVRSAQSADVIYVGAIGYAQQQIERRATDSWSIVDYTKTAVKGPFRPINVSNITLSASAVNGDITLTASKPLFRPGHVGALFRLISTGQLVSAALAAASTYTNPILVTGAGNQRNLSILILGVWVGTLSVQYSLGTPGNWVDSGTTYGGNGNFTFNDKFDNQTIYYRLGFDAGNYTSGSASVTLTIGSGSIPGIVRITGYTSNTQVSAAVLTALGGTTATSNWYEGAWSPYRGYPGTPALFQGRLWWFGVSIFGSVSDDYPNFDDTVIGASAPIIGQFDSGPVDNIYWALGLQQLVVGHALAEVSCRSTYLGDVLSTTNFNTMPGSTQGAANVAAVQIDKSGIFVQNTGSRVFMLDLDVYSFSYKSTELTLLVPDFNAAGIVQIALQNKPDRRLHCVRADGTAGLMVFDSTENVTCWFTVTAANGGFIEDVSILPPAGSPEDQVYYVVRRVVNGATVRYHEKWALESECTGLPVAKHLDAHIAFAAAPGAQVTSIGGLGHLVGQKVSVWGWNTLNPYVDGNGNQCGLDLGTYVVDGTGTISGLNLAGVSYPVTNAVVGLPYSAQWQSLKQAFAAAMGTPLNQPKRIPRLGLVLHNTHAQGIQSGPDFGRLDDLPMADLPYTSPADGATADLNAIINDYDHQMAAHNDIWSTDSRVCLQAKSPRPCTVLAFTAEMDTSG